MGPIAQATERDIIHANGDVWTGGTRCCTWYRYLSVAIMCLFVSWFIYNAPLFYEIYSMPSDVRRAVVHVLTARRSATPLPTALTAPN